MEISENSTQESGFVLPLNGRVVIIDDNIKEAIPLMNVLSKHHIPFIYFDGNKDNLPDKPVDNVRIIFLDIQLEGMEGVQNDKTKLSALFNVINKVVGDKPDLFIIIAWTKHEELIDEIKNGLSSKPLFTLTLEKRECKKQNSEEFDINIINEKLLEAIKKFGVFKFFLEWENIVHESAGRTVNEISSIITRDDNWNQNIIVILIMLAEAYAGQQADNNHDLNAMLAINNLLLDIIENRIQNTSNNASSINNQTVNLTFINRIKGELNRRLLIANEQNNSVIPGNVYKNEFSIKCDINNLCNNNRIPEELNKQENHIILEVSPYCDYAQKKWKCHRILPGVIWPEQYGNMIKKADYIYKTPLFLINDQLCYFVFDLRYLASLPLENDYIDKNLLNRLKKILPCFDNINLKDKTSLYRFRKELVVDIQSKIAGHINRPGVTYAG
ncbi:MAG: hypothetical protein NUV92_08470 [Ignavibacteria bacterium]|jgi:hypothetical protein|nr:hypothetical protein [Ignavibacteria bacterium]MDH7528972.1 hypothetical protein [Ignavibacteria bacterium]